MDSGLSEFFRVGITVILSIAILGTAGLIFQQRTVKQLFQFELEKLKLTTQSTLEIIWKEYSISNPNIRLPDNFNFKDMVENFTYLDDSTQEKILALTQIQLDLMSNGINSHYFVEIVNMYGIFVGM